VKIPASVVRIDYSVEGVVTPPPPEPLPEPTPTPPPSPAPTDCGRAPDGVRVGPALDWTKSNTHRFEMGREILSIPFFTGPERDSYGTLNTHYTTAEPSTRTTWISRCPSNDLKDALSPSAISYGYETSVLQWTQGAASAPRKAQMLEPNTQYYFNVIAAMPDKFDVTTCTKGFCPFLLELNRHG
jgi:hypothetical protein